jgi:hypothetical protein
MQANNDTIVATYDYRDANGKFLFQTVRFRPKRFAQRRPDPANKDRWIWDLAGVTREPYHLPELLSQPDQPVLIVEGEKDVHTLEGLGFVATTNPMGAGKWLHPFGRYFAGRRAVILPDHDHPGLLHAGQVAGNLMLWGSASIRVVLLPELLDGGDVSDWVDGRADPRAALIEQVKAVPEWRLSRD